MANLGLRAMGKTPVTTAMIGTAANSGVVSAAQMYE